MEPSPTLLARGPWQPERVRSTWIDDAWRPPAELDARADEAIEELRRRGSPTHDGLAARLITCHADADGLALELQPSRWALRLVDHPEARSLTALCVVRSEDGRWLAGRRAQWLASWAGRWALGAGGAVEVGENAAETLARELEEEWRLVPTALTVEALVGLPAGPAMLVGLATVAAGSQPVPDEEHDEFAWWPADPASWPGETDERLRRMAMLLAAARG
jgi:ADP-ribose pyrophosphatase YjhB (NUDIX family)